MKKLIRILGMFFVSILGFFALDSCNISNNNSNALKFENIELNDTTFIYDGEVHSLELIGDLPPGTVVEFENNNQINAGTYQVKTTLTCEGYASLILNANLTIEKKNLSGIYFHDATFEYDGQPKSLSILGELPKGVEVEYYNNEQVNFGKYTIIAHFIDTTGNYQVPNDMYANLVILKKDFNLNNINFNDKTIIYDGKPHSLEITGKLPKGVEVSYENNTLTNVGSQEAIVHFKHNNLNYNDIPDMHAKLTILKKGISGISLTSKTLIYDGKPHSLEITGKLPEGVEVKYINNNKTNAGIYEVMAIFNDTTGNYLDLDPLTAKLTINKANYNMENIRFNDQSLVYDGKPHSLEIDGELPDGVEVIYSQNSLVSAGIYYIEASFKHNNYNYNNIENLGAYLIITKKGITGISFSGGKFIYDGKPHSLKITGELPDGVEVNYINNNKVNAGMYEVTALFNDKTGNYTNLDPLTVNLIINKAKYDLTDIEFNNKVYEYDGNLHELKINGNLPEDVTVIYENNKLTNVGSIQAIAHFVHNNVNYEEIDDKIAYLIITKKSISNIEFNGKTFIYDGLEHSLEIEGNLPEGVEVTYFNNNKTNVGKHEVIAIFNDTTGNYLDLEPLKAQLEIIKSVYDMSGVTFEDKTYVYDGLEHSLEIKGNLPEGVTVSYTNNVLKNVGKISVIASFKYDIENYEQITPMVANLEIVKQTITNITMTDKTYVYDGSAHSLEINEHLPEGVEVKYYNNNQTIPGIYSVTAHFIDTNEYKNYHLPNDITANLIISKATYDMSKITFESKTYEYDGLPHSLKINGELPNGVTVKYENNECINVCNVTVIAHFINNNPYYNDPLEMKANLIISKKIIDGITFEGETIVYDGLPHSLKINGELPKEIKVTYSNKNIIEAGKYEIFVTFIDESNGNYEVPEMMSANLIINKATYDMSNVLFEDEIIHYDGLEHSLKIKGDLPTGVMVSYSDNNLQKDAGDFLIIAEFISDNKNYNEIKPLSAHLVIYRETFTITFKQQNHDDIVKDILYLEGLPKNEWPELEKVKGYNVEWEDIDLSCVKENYIINAIYTPITYNLKYVVNDEVVETLPIAYGEKFIVKSMNFNNQEIENIKLNGWIGYNSKNNFNSNILTKDKIFYADEIYEYNYDYDLLLCNNNIITKEDFNKKTNGAFEFNISENDVFLKKSDIYKGILNLDTLVIPMYIIDGNRIYKVNGIDDNTFSNVTLKNIVLPDSVSYIGENAFYNSKIEKLLTSNDITNLNGLNIVNSMKISKPKQIMSNAFNDSEFRIIEIPRGIENIVAPLFNNSKKIDVLEKLIIPNSVKNINSNLFSDLNSHAAIIYCENATKPKGWSNNWYTGRVAWNYGGISGTTINGLEWALKNDNTISICGFNEVRDNLFNFDTFKTSNEIEGFVVNEVIDKAFGNLQNYESNRLFNIPNTITKIGKQAFYNVYFMEDIVIPLSVETIGEDAFQSYYAIYCYAKTKPEGWNERWFHKDVNIVWNYGGKKGITSQGMEWYLTGNNDITIYRYNQIMDELDKKEIIIPETIEGYPVSTLIEYLFFNVSNLERIIIPNNVTNIGYSAMPSFHKQFSNYMVYCSAREKPKNWDNLWIDEPNNENIIWNYGGQYGVSKEGLKWILTNDKNIKIYSYISKSSNLIIPETIENYPVVEIKNNTFEKCNYLKEVELPITVNKIGYKAFPITTEVIYCAHNSEPIDYDSQWCSDETIIIWNYLRKDKTDNFKWALRKDKTLIIYGYDGNLKEVIIPSKINEYPVSEISQYAFNNSSTVEEVELPNSITKVGYNAFSFNIKCIYCEHENLPSGFNTNWCDKDSIIVYGYVNKGTYNNLTWVLRKNNTIAISGFNGDESKVIIPDEINGYPVVEILQYVFKDCLTLKELILSDNNVNLGVGFLDGCDNIEELIIPSSVTNINQSILNNVNPDLTLLLKGDTMIEEGTPYRCVSNYANEHGITQDGIKWALREDGMLSIYNYVGNSNELIIPNIIDGKKVSTIEKKAFNGNELLRKVDISNGLIRIKDSAFMNCKLLESINMADSIFEIELNAFANCRKLNNVHLSNNILKLPEGLLYNCELLKNINIPNKAISIDNNAFANCLSLTNIVIPNSLRNIGDFAFANCSNLLTVTMFDGIETIGNNAFANCEKLVNVNIPNTLKELGEKAFNNCRSLVNINISNKLNTIKLGTFSNCENLENIVIPPSVTNVENLAFSNCSKLKTLSLHNGLEIIGNNAFEYCEKLDSLDLPNTLKELGEKAFYKCISLKSLILSNNLLAIELETFKGCVNLTNIEIPASVNRIAKNAFYQCSLNEVVLLGQNINIESKAFYSIKESMVVYSASLSMPDTWNEQSFPYDVKFYWNYGGKKGITSNGLQWMLNNSNEIKIVNYIEPNGPYQYLTIPEEIEGYKVTIIGEKAFADTIWTKKINIPNTVTTLESFAFSNTILENILVPKSIINWGTQVFSNNKNIRKIKFEAGLKSIGEKAFLFIDSKNISDIIIPESVENIGVYGFYNESSSIVSTKVFCESLIKPDGWSSKWIYGYNNIYWGNQWKYNSNGNPELIN